MIPTASVCVGMTITVAAFARSGVKSKPAESNLDAIVRRLPTSLRESWAALFNSESTQTASMQSPRIVMFNSAGVSATFTGVDPELEMWRFDQKSDRFRFFSTQNAVDANSFLSSKNPPTMPGCAACHGPDPRPIWKVYPQWSGAYGSNDDRIAGEEVRPYSRFLKRRENSKVYQWLRIPGVDLENAPAESPYTAEKHQAFTYRPNTRLGFIAARLNARRVARMLKHSPLYDRYKEVLLFTYNDCDWLPNEDAVRKSVAKELRRRQSNKRGERFRVAPRSSTASNKLSFEELNAQLGVEMRDIDIRYSYYDAANNRLIFDMPKVNGTYDPQLNNLYSDGWAIYGITEYVASRIYVDLVSSNPSLAGTFKGHSLLEFYQEDSERNRLDRPFMLELETLATRFVRGQNVSGCRALVAPMAKKFLRERPSRKR
jgi:hypothetical protein